MLGTRATRAALASSLPTATMLCVDCDLTKDPDNGSRGTRMRRVSRFIVRLAVLVVAALAAAQLVGAHASRVLPSLSPFLVVTGAVADRVVSAWMLLCLPLLILAMVRRRWFCRYLCPTGFALECVGRVGARRKDRHRSWPRFGAWLVAFTLGGAAAGFPPFLWLDPLAVFNGFWGTVGWPPPGTAGLLALPFLVLVLLTLWRPNAWCRRCCPLGFMQELLWEPANRLRRFARRGVSTREAPPRPEPLFRPRREAMLAIGGILAALAARRFAAGRLAVRPPGAADEARMAGLCVRCGNCVRACPEGIIRPDLGSTGAIGWMTPVVRFDPGYCLESCRECVRVCPTGAISSLTLEEKQRVVIGTAVLVKSECLGWAKSEHCMVCQDYCPYEAVRSVVHNYVTCPEVDELACRGCGACEVSCPAGRRAIAIKGLSRQWRVG